MIGDTLTLDYQADQNGSATITVTGTSNLVDVDDTFLVTVAGADDPPVVANALSDVAVNMNANDTEIDLSNVFNDLDDDNASILKTADSNNTALVGGHGERKYPDLGLSSEPGRRRDHHGDGDFQWASR